MNGGLASANDEMSFCYSFAISGLLLIVPPSVYTPKRHNGPLPPPIYGQTS